MLMCIQTLGTFSEDGKRLMKLDSTMDALKRLELYLRRDDPKERNVFYKIGEWKVVKSHLIPLFESNCSDKKLVYQLLCLFIRLTSPFTESIKVSEQKRHLQVYKDMFTKSNIPIILLGYLEAPLASDWDNNDEFFNWIELVLTLFKNLLAVPNADAQDDSVSDDFKYLHDRFLLKLSEDCVFDFFSFMISAIVLKKRQYPLAFLMLECLHYVFHLEQADTLLRPVNNQNRFKSLLRQEKMLQKNIALSSSVRHSRFGGTVQLKGEHGEVLRGAGAGTLLSNARTPLTQRRYLNDRVRSSLKSFIDDLMDNGMDVFLCTVLEGFEKNAVFTVAQDYKYFARLVAFVLEYHRKSLAKKGIPFDVSRVSILCGKGLVKFVLKKIDDFTVEGNEDVLNIESMVLLYKEQLCLIWSLQHCEEPNLRQSGKNLMANMFYHSEHMRMLSDRLESYKKGVHSYGYLVELVKASAMALDLLRDNGGGILLVKRKKGKELSFKFKEFVALFSRNKVIQNCMIVLYKFDIDPKPCKYVLKVFEAVAFDLKAIPRFFQFSILSVLLKILTVTSVKSKTFSQLRLFSEKVITQFVQVMSKDPSVVLDALLWKSNKTLAVLQQSYFGHMGIDLADGSDGEAEYKEIKRNRWTPVEDEILNDLMQKGDISMQVLEHQLPLKNAKQIKYRLRKLQLGSVQTIAEKDQENVSVDGKEKILEMIKGRDGVDKLIESLEGYLDWVLDCFGEEEYAVELDDDWVDQVMQEMGCRKPLNDGISLYWRITALQSPQEIYNVVRMLKNRVNPV